MEIIAHRGASGDHPEHTLAAYEEAVAQGADGVECDIRLTADGHLVCVHDATLDRTTDGTGRVSRHTVEQLRRLNAGTPDDPQPVLEFGDLLGFVKDNKDLGFFIETKHPVPRGLATERKLAEDLARHGLDRDERVRIISFSARSISDCRRRFPHLDAIQLVERPGARTFARRMAARPPVRGGSLTGDRGDSRGVHRWRRPLYGWTANRYVDVTWARDRGIRWLATDWPGKAREALAANVRTGGYLGARGKEVS